MHKGLQGRGNRRGHFVGKKGEESREINPNCGVLRKYARIILINPLHVLNIVVRYDAPDPQGGLSVCAEWVKHPSARPPCVRGFPVLSLTGKVAEWFIYRRMLLRHRTDGTAVITVNVIRVINSLFKC